MGMFARKSTRKKLSVLMATLFALSVLATLVFAVPMAGADEPPTPPPLGEPGFKMPDAEQPSAVEAFLPRKEIPKDVIPKYIDTKSIASAQSNTTTTDGHFEAVANEKQLEMLNRLYGTEISFGKLVGTVFPEALEYIPESALRGMYQQNMV